MNNKKIFRFGILHLFYATAVVAAAIALQWTWGVAWASLVIVFWIVATRHCEPEFEAKRIEKESKSKPQGTSGFTATKLLAVFTIFAVLAFLLMVAVERYHQVTLRAARAGERSPPIRIGSSRRNNVDNVGQLMRAFHNYHSVYGHFPPAYLADEHGKPMHSWRVLILPFIEQNRVYEQYDFDEPWDGPNNSKLVDQLSDMNPFSDYSMSEDDWKQLTTFKLVTGPGTAFDKDKTVTFDDITAGYNNTIGLVEDSSKPVCWMSPADLTVDQAVEIFDLTKNSSSIAFVTESKFSKAVYFNAYRLGILDGTVKSGSRLDDPDEIRRFFDIDDRETRGLIDLVFNQKRKYERKAEGYILLGINLLLANLPGFWLRFRRRT